MKSNQIIIDEWRKIIQAKEDTLTTCKYCGAKFVPSATASVKDTCHPCIMASL